MRTVAPARHPGAHQRRASPSIDQLLIDPAGPARPALVQEPRSTRPARCTGYGAKTLPGVREAIEQRRFDDARAYVGRTAAVLEDYASRLDQVAAMGTDARRDHRPDDRARRRGRCCSARAYTSTAGATRRDSYGSQGAVILFVSPRSWPSTRSAGSIITRARPKPKWPERRR